MLKGIEAQGMITRTAEIARDAGAMQRKNDVVRDYLAVQTQALAEREGQQVAQTLHAQEVVIHPDKQEKRHPDREKREERSSEENGSLAEADREYAVLSEDNHNIIDIKV